MSGRYKSRGWQREGYRHMLAAKGIKTARTKSGVLAHVHGIPIKAKPLPPGQAYPVSPQEVKARMEKLPAEDLKGLKAVEFVPPKDKDQKDAWAQMLRGRKTMLIFSQPAGENGEISGQDPEGVRSHMLNYVVPHEVGHHVALNRRNLTDKDVSMAEARADAYAFGYDVEDEDAKHFKHRHER